MKTSELRKKLKNCRIEIRANEGSYGCMSVWLCIEVQDPYGWDFLCRINSQCNDITYPHEYPKESAKETYSSLYYPGYTGTYAARTEEEIRYSSMNETVGKTLFQIIRSEVDKRNLSYVYPDCEMSQIVSVLVETFKAHIVKNEINGSHDTYEWKRKRREKVESYRASLVN